MRGLFKKYVLGNRTFAQNTTRYCDGGLLGLIDFRYSPLCLSKVGVHSCSVVVELDAPPLKPYIPIARLEMPAKLTDFSFVPCGCVSSDDNGLVQAVVPSCTANDVSAHSQRSENSVNSAARVSSHGEKVFDAQARPRFAQSFNHLHGLEHTRNEIARVHGNCRFVRHTAYPRAMNSNRQTAVPWLSASRSSYAASPRGESGSRSSAEMPCLRKRRRRIPDAAVPTDVSSIWVGVNTTS